MALKINTKLEKAVSFNPTRQSHLESIEAICQKIEHGDLALPWYQRDVSWTMKQCVSLLNYELASPCAISPISINKTTASESANDNSEKKVRQLAFITREPLSGPTVDSVVDGQQRLTTNYKAYTNNNEFRNIVLDFVRGEFLEETGQIKPNQIPVGILLYKDTTLLDEYIPAHRQLNSFEVMNMCAKIRQKFFQYYYIINIAENLSEDEQIKWFTVLNNAGTSVSKAQLSLASLQLQDIDIYVDYTQVFMEKLEEISESKKSYVPPKKTDTTYPIAALNPILERDYLKNKSLKNIAPISPDEKSTYLRKLTREELNGCFTKTLELLETTIKFIKSNNLPAPSRIDYVTYLIGYFAFNPVVNTEYVVNWYKTVNFTDTSNSDRRKEYARFVKNN